MSTETLIALCERAVVPVGEWHDRDSASAQRQVGEALALLRAGAKWQESTDPKSNDRTIWIRIQFPGFNAFEEGHDDENTWADELFYIPTAQRLDDTNGRDWY
jgi:hypothetical protein